jgi:hypothetical protein
VEFTDNNGWAGDSYSLVRVDVYAAYLAWVELGRLLFYRVLIVEISYGVKGFFLL